MFRAKSDRYSGVITAKGGKLISISFIGNGSRAHSALDLRLIAPA